MFNKSGEIITVNYTHYNSDYNSYPSASNRSKNIDPDCDGDSAPDYNDIKYNCHLYHHHN